MQIMPPGCHWLSRGILSPEWAKPRVEREGCLETRLMPQHPRRMCDHVAIRFWPGTINLLQLVRESRHCGGEGLRAGRVSTTL